CSKCWTERGSPGTQIRDTRRDKSPGDPLVETHCAPGCSPFGANTGAKRNVYARVLTAQRRQIASMSIDFTPASALPAAAELAQTTIQPVLAHHRRPR